jgi:hypothetical protein
MDRMSRFCAAGPQLGDGLQQAAGILRRAEKVHRFLHAVVVVQRDHHDRLSPRAGDDGRRVAVADEVHCLLEARAGVREGQDFHDSMSWKG